MTTITQHVEDILLQDDIALAAAQAGLLNLSSYARAIKPRLQARAMKDIQDGSIIAALSRITTRLQPAAPEATNVIQSLAVHANLEGITYERSAAVSAQIRTMYHQINVGDHTFLTVTQGINEVTIIAESRIAQEFRTALADAQKIYDKNGLIGVTAKFKVGNLEIPNLIHQLTRRLAYKNVNIIEIVSTATELTFIIDKKDLEITLSQLQKDI